MGGSAPAPDYTPMLKEIEMQRKQMAEAQKSADEANRMAAIRSQDNAAMQNMTQANLSAQQGLGRQQAYQQALDSAAQQTAKAASGMAGTAQTGGAIDPASAAAAKLASMGATSGKQPATTQSMAGYPGATKATPVNRFNLPSDSGVAFGGY
jgi:hypothetical protein